jgi:hypothetical protein
MSQLNAQEKDIDTVEFDEIAIYGTGGAGIGITKYFEADRAKRIPGYASLHPVYLDTSKASTFGVPEQHFYHLEKEPGETADGSGGVRSEHGSTIIEYTREILQRFKPKKWNIVVHSTTGGSGSVMGPSIVSELLAMGQNVIVFTVGGDDTLNYIKNTISVLSGYGSMAELRERPVVLRYLQNGLDGTIEDVDRKIQLDISCLAVLLSGQNKNLDSRDIANVLDFSRKGVTSYGPQVAVLHIQQGKLEIGDRSIISLATLNDSLNNTRVSQPVEFQRVGVPMYVNEEQKDLKFPLHYAITDGFVDIVMRNLRKQRDEFALKADSRVVRNKLTTGKEKVAANGLVFDE